jgi:hypothetical protein
MFTRYVYIAAILMLVCASGGALYASTGSIDTTDKYAWGTIGGWTNFAPTNGNVAVSDSAITGYAWSTNDGWINFAPTNGGVHNDGNGNLSGFAWDSTNGWISFQGVTIDSNGLFHGQATGIAADGSSNIITFDCTHCRVVTTWRPSGTTPSPISSDTTKHSSNNVHESTRNSSSSAPAYPTPTTAPVTPIEPPASQAIPGVYPQNQNIGQGTSGNTKKDDVGQEREGSGIIPNWLTSPKKAEDGRSIQSGTPSSTATTTVTQAAHRRRTLILFAVILGGIALLAVVFFVRYRRRI